MKIVKTCGLGKSAVAMPQKYNGFLGLSLTSPYCKKNSILPFIHFGLKHFKKFVLLPVDIPYQYNYRVFENLSNQEALNKAKTLGDHLAYELLNIITKADLQDKIQILRYENLMQDKRAVTILNYFEKLILESDEFCKDIRLHLSAQVPHIERRLEAQKNEWAGYDFKRKILYRFLVNEIAMFIFIQEFMGYPIRLSAYPESNVMIKIYQGKYLSLKELGLKGDIGHIQIKTQD